MKTINISIDDLNIRISPSSEPSSELSNGRKTVYHYVFGAGKEIPQNEKIIELARKTIKVLESYYDDNASCTGCYDGPIFTIEETDKNFAIKAEAEDYLTLIKGCMDFARDLQIEEIKSLNPNLKIKLS